MPVINQLRESIWLGEPVENDGHSNPLKGRDVNWLHLAIQV